MAKLTKGDLVEYNGDEYTVIGEDEINEAIILEDKDGEKITVDMSQLMIVEADEAETEEVVTEKAEEKEEEAEVVAEKEEEAEEGEQLDELTRAGETIKGKANYNTSQMTASVIKAMSGEGTSDPVTFFNKMMQLMHNNDWGIGSGAAGKNKASVAASNPHPDGTSWAGDNASRVKAMSKEDLERILGSEKGLSEEFKANASTLFEASVNLRVATVTEELEAKYAEQLAEATEEMTTSLEASINTYLTKSAKQWLEENKVAVESTLRNEITENFMNDFFGLLREYNFDLPEEKVDVVEQMTARNDELEAKLNEQMNSNMELCSAIEEYAAQRAFDSVCEGLALTQIEKFKTLAEDIDFDGDEESFVSKLELVKEHHFGSKKAPTSTMNEEVDIEEDTPKKANQDIDPSVANYVSAISRTTKR